MTDTENIKNRNAVSSWIWPRKFRVLLFMLVGMLIFYPYLQAEGRTGRTLFEVLFTALLFASTYVLCTTRRHTIIALVLGVPTLLAHLMYVIFPESFSYGFPMGTFVVFYCYMTFSALRHVARPDEVTADIIAGAVCVYILLGMVWAMIYAYIENAFPGSFVSTLSGDPITGAIGGDVHDTHFTTFLYFSYTTLTTLGYGDILPKSASARSLTSLEAMTGVLYVGAFVARLITAYQPKRRRTDFIDQ